MNTISQCLSNFKDVAGFSMENGGFYAGRINQITTLTENSKDITILTAEGDKVTISADSQSTGQYTTYNGLARVNGISLSLGGNSFSVNSSSEFSMLVEGDLNEQEMKDIRNAMKTIDKIMQSALSGNLENVMAMTNKIGNLKSISSFEASMESNKTVVVEQALMMMAEEAVDGTANGDIEESTANLDALKPAEDKIIDVIEQSGVKPSKFIKPLNSYMSDQFFNRSSEDEHDGHESAKHHEMGRKMMSELLERVRQLDKTTKWISGLEQVNESLSENIDNIDPVQCGSANMGTDSSILEG